MSLAKKIQNFIKLCSKGISSFPQPSQAPLPPDVITQLLEAALGGGAPTGVKVATVYRCVQLLSDSVAQLPLRLQKKRGGVYVDAVDNPLYYLLAVEPNAKTSAVDLIKGIIVEVLMDGNAYIVPDYKVEKPQYESLTLCTRDSVTYDENADIYQVRDTINGLNLDLYPSEIIHIKGMTGADPRKGISVLASARTAIDIAGAGDAETLKRFRNGGNVRGILKNAMTGRGLDVYDDEQMKQMAEEVQARLNSNQAITVTPGDSSFEQLSMTSSDMQFLESRKFAVRDICRFFGVHPSFVFDDTSNNYKSAEMANVAFLSNTLNPLLCKIEAEFQRKLIGHPGFGRLRIIFDRQGIYAMDLDSKVRYYTKMLGTGAMSVNDIRIAENQPEVEGGDKVFVSANLKGIDEMQSQEPAVEEKPEEKPRRTRKIPKS